MVSTQEILDDVMKIYKKIDQCNRSKLDYEQNILKENESIVFLNSMIEEDKIRIENGKRPRYDQESMLQNIERCKNNIKLFRDTINKEDQTIERFNNIIKVLQEDMKRPKEIIFNRDTGVIINDGFK